MGSLIDEAPSQAADHARAHALFEAACADGSRDGCLNAGIHYDRGIGVAENVVKARELFERGCSSGDPAACAELGTLYDRGRGVAPNRAQARTLYERGCEGGYAMACNNLGVLDEQDSGASGALGKAREGYERACAFSYPPGCTNLGRLDWQGKGGPVDQRKATAAFKRGCEPKETAGTDAEALFGQEEACNWYWTGALDGFAEDLPKNRALQLLEGSCMEGGRAIACVRLAAAYRHEKSAERAIELIKRACRLGENRACRALEGARTP